MKRWHFIPVIVFGLLVIVLLTKLLRIQDGEQTTNLESVLIGQPVPVFTLQDLRIEAVQHSPGILKGERLLLNVWATWCPTCYAEHEMLNQLKAQGVRIVGLNYKDDRRKAIAWLDRLGDPYGVNLYDPDGLLGLDLGVYGAPETYFIDAQGIIRYRHVGDINPQNWQEHLSHIFNGLAQ